MTCSGAGVNRCRAWRMRWTFLPRSTTTSLGVRQWRRRCSKSGYRSWRLAKARQQPSSGRAAGGGGAPAPGGAAAGQEKEKKKRKKKKKKAPAAAVAESDDESEDDDAAPPAKKDGAGAPCWKDKPKMDAATFKAATESFRAQFPEHCNWYMFSKCNRSDSESKFKHEVPAAFADWAKGVGR